MTRFLNLFGSPNIIGGSNICFGPYMVTGAAIFGWPLGARVSLTGVKGASGEVASRCLLIVGLNAAQSYPRLAKGVREAKESGSKIIVIDPRMTQTVALADLWLQVRPGTDVALLLSMINVIIEEGLYDKDFVDRWCYGFDKLAERARDYPPEKVAEITGVPAEKIREAARMYATNLPAYSTNGMGNEHLSNAIEAIQARMILTAITGKIDVNGGQTLDGPHRCVTSTEMSLPDMLSQKQKAKQLGADRFKLMCWPGYDLIQGYVKKVWGKASTLPMLAATAPSPAMWRAMLNGKPYSVKAAISVASNPMVTAGNTKLVYKALKSLELYVVLDFWLTPSAELADYVLASASWLERPFFCNPGSGLSNSIWAGEQALPSTIPGEYEHRTDYEIYRELMIRLGKGEYFPWKSYEESFDYRLKPLGIAFKEFMSKNNGFDFPLPQYKKYEKVGFATPTGKVELYSTIFEKLGYDPLPRYEEPAEGPISNPELAREYPLILITGGRFLPMYHSEHRQVDSVRRRHPHPILQINPETAAKLGISNRDWVWIETLRGRTRMKCQYFDGIDPMVVHAEHGWWFPELPGEEPWLHGAWESNVNVLTDDDPDVCNKLHGGWPLRTALCKIYKLKGF